MDTNTTEEDYDFEIVDEQLKDPTKTELYFKVIVIGNSGNSSPFLYLHHRCWEILCLLKGN